MYYVKHNIYIPIIMIWYLSSRLFLRRIIAVVCWPGAEKINRWFKNVKHYFNSTKLMGHFLCVRKQTKQTSALALQLFSVRRVRSNDQRRLPYLLYTTNVQWIPIYYSLKLSRVLLSIREIEQKMGTIPMSTWWFLLREMFWPTCRWMRLPSKTVSDCFLLGARALEFVMNRIASTITSIIYTFGQCA